MILNMYAYVFCPFPNCFFEFWELLIYSRYNSFVRYMVYKYFPQKSGILSFVNSRLLCFLRLSLLCSPVREHVGLCPGFSWAPLHLFFWHYLEAVSRHWAWVIIRLTLFVSHLSGITVVYFLMSSVLKTLCFMFLFFVVQVGGKSCLCYCSIVTQSQVILLDNVMVGCSGSVFSGARCAFSICDFKSFSKFWKFSWIILAFPCFLFSSFCLFLCIWFSLPLFDICYFI